MPMSETNFTQQKKLICSKFHPTIRNLSQKQISPHHWNLFWYKLHTTQKIFVWNKLHYRKPVCNKFYPTTEIWVCNTFHHTTRNLCLKQISPHHRIPMSETNFSNNTHNTGFILIKLWNQWAHFKSLWKLSTAKAGIWECEQCTSCYGKFPKISNTLFHTLLA